MAYRFGGTDPVLRTSPGAYTGFSWGDSAHSGAALFKRNAAGAWHGLQTWDNGSGVAQVYGQEFNPSNQIAAGFNTGTWSSAATFNNTTDFMIVGWTWAGTTNSWTYRWKIGSNAWSSEVESSNATSAPFDITSGWRRIIGNEGGLGDDASLDLVCAGEIKSNLSQATFESLDMVSFATWQSVFTGASAWLMGFETVSTQTDRTGNGGDELSRSAGITLVSDPVGWSWGNEQVLRPDADLATTGWATAPLWSKIADSSDATVVTGTLS